MIFSAYRADQFSDPDSYVDNLGMVLELYPNEVIAFITDPRTGVQRHCKWPPSIAEITEACDRKMAEIARTQRLQNWGKGNAPALDAPREPRPTYEELKAKYGDDFGITAGPPKDAPEKAPSWDSIVTAYQADPDMLKRLIGDDGEEEPPC